MAIFIRLDYDFNRVMSYRNGYNMSKYQFNGIRLLPEQPNRYVQRTDTPTGLVLDNPTVEVFTLCGKLLADITDNFTVDSTFQDSDTGLEQLYWSLVNLPDFGDQLIYLRINNGSDGYVYSNPFKISGFEEGEVPSYRFDYRDDELYVMQSIGLEIYFKKYDWDYEEESYRKVSDGKVVALSSYYNKYEKCITSIMEYEVMGKFIEMMTSNEKYCDYQAVTFVGAPEETDFSGNENFSQWTFGLQRDGNDTYNPNYVPPAPPPPPAYQIILNSVTPSNATSVNYNFELINFTPTYLKYQYSLDEINWNDNTSDANSPQSKPVPNYNTTPYYYRITARPAYEVDSNIVQITPPSITITNIVSFDTSFLTTGNKYDIYYTFSGFPPIFLIAVEVSVNGINWQTITGTPNTNPKPFVTPQSSQEFTYFRLRYFQLGIVSEPYEFSL